MAKLFVCSLLLVLLVQNGRAEQQQQLDFQDWLHNAKQFLDGVAKDLKEKVGLPEDPNGADVLRVINEHNEKLAQNLKETGKKIEEQLQSNEALQTVVENIKSKFSEEARKLKENNSELAANFQKLGDSLQGTWNTLTQEMEKSYSEFNKAGGKREELENYFKSLYDNVKSGAKELEGVGSDKRPDFHDVLSTTKQFLEGRAEEIKKTMGVPDNINSEALAKRFKEHNEKMVRNLEETSKIIEEEFKSNPALQAFLENLKIKLNEEAEKLKMARSDNIGKSLENSWASLTKLMEQTYGEFQNAGGNKEELGKHFESFLNKLRQSAQEFEGVGSDKRPDFHDVLSTTKQFLEGRAEEIKKTMAVPDNINSEALAKRVKEHNENIVRNLEETSKIIEEEFKSNPALQAFLKNLKIKLNEEAEKLKMAKSDNISKSLESSLASLTKLMEPSYEEFQKAGGNKKELEKHFEPFLNKLRQSAQEFGVFHSSKTGVGSDKRPDFHDVLSTTKQFLEGRAEEIKKTMAVPDNINSEALAKMFKEHNENIVRNLEETSKIIEEEFKSNPDLQAFLENLKIKLNEEAEKLKMAIRLGSDNIGKSLESSLASLTKLMEQSYEEFQKAGGNKKELDKHFESFLNKLRQSVQGSKAAPHYKQSDFQQLLQNTKQFLDKEAEQVMQTIGHFDSLKRYELIKFFREYNENLSRHLMVIRRLIEEEFKSTPELHSFIEKIKTNLNKEVEKLKSSNDENIGKSLQNNWDSVMKTMQKLSQDYKKVYGNNEELDKIFELFLIKLKQSAEEFKKFVSKS